VQRQGIVALLKVAHLLSLGLWAGGAIFFSFVAAPRIFAYLRDELPSNPPPGTSGLTSEIGRRLAGDTVGAIFPAYFTLQIIAGCLALATATLLIQGGERLAKLRTTLVAVALVAVAAHAITIYPQSVRVLAAHYRAADAGDGSEAAALRQQFGTLHGISQTLDLLVILIVVACLVLLANSRRHGEKVRGSE
jgi:uncharacterized membrane protein